MFRVKLTAKAEKDLKKISKAHQIIIGRIFEELKEDPLIGKPLTREMTGRLSYRVSIYRIVYKLPRAKSPRYYLSSLHERAKYSKFLGSMYSRSRIHSSTYSPRCSASEYKVNFKDEIIFILTAGHRKSVYN